MNTGHNFYVIVGREGPRICDYSGFRLNGAGIPFGSRNEAQQWLDTFYKPKGATFSSVIAGRVSLQNSEHLTGYPNSTTYWEETEDEEMDQDDLTSCSDLSSSSSSSRSTPPPETEMAPPPRPVAAPAVVLSAEQQRVLDMTIRGENVFFTGPAGTGKSVLLREIIRALKQKYNGSIGDIAVTAPTGIAGLNIGGCTVHSFAGIGLGKEKALNLATRIALSQRLRQRWLDVRTLIIDEISMLDGRLFDKLEEIARRVREDDRPFGGIQLILSGDFCQLPPVPDESHQFKMASTFAFDAESWYRNEEFVDLLGQMRLGQLEERYKQILNGLSRPLVYSDGIEPTYLFPLRAQVEGCNRQRLRELPTPEVTYQAMDSAGVDVYGKEISRADAFKLLDRLVSPQTVTLKEGAQVMLIQNVGNGLVNGSCGKIIDFIDIHEAMTRHIQIVESKGRREPDLSKPRLSQPLQKLVPLNEAIFSNSQKWPLVQFISGTLLLCAPGEFSVEGFMGNVEARRMQVPLILSWAISIHKSQGQTLQRVKIDLGKVFEKGQAYVAISRATTMEHLEIVNFNPVIVTAHPRVIAWQHQYMSSLSQVHAAPPDIVPQTTSVPHIDVDVNMERATTTLIKVEEEDDDLWDEMDSDYARSQYFKSIYKK
ncbi:hypothetical protein D9758_000091 [Tetrapyrgos nigripes]|uniref:ATP-dependent DNA helicase PIF1 n=1 Tax=Tetrapyrgos nigripes TaxID=182062 RepID=A0A8H5H1J4_9AGAR|nr:hypothetical protein D9758_000091 [Tetrapyrgos nigripes]